MSETKASHMQQIKGALKKMADDQVARVESFYAQAAKVEEQRAAQMATAMDDMTKLSKDTFAYFGQLSAEWRKLTLDAAKKTTDLLAPQG